MKIIIRGNYRVGKTTMVQELLKEIGPGAGFYTENRTDGFGGRGKKTGSDIVPLAGSFLGGALLRCMDEHPDTMSSCRPGEFKQKVGKYTVMVDDFEKVALDCLSNSFLRKAGLVVIDEIGPHLKYTEKFNDRLRRIFRDWEGEERQGHLVVTMPIKSDFEPMPQELLEMSDVEVIELTVRNWDEVYEDLSKRLKVKPQGGAVMSKHLKMAGMLSKMESAIKEGQGEKAKDIYQGDEQREEMQKEEMQKNVLSIRGEDRRY